MKPRRFRQVRNIAILRAQEAGAVTYTLIGADGIRYESETKGNLGGHRRNRIYGRLDCPSALRAIAKGRYVEHRVFFADETTAMKTGYRPCATCMREQYAAWKTSRQAR